jgi:hypothetical protein
VKPARQGQPVPQHEGAEAAVVGSTEIRLPFAFDPRREAIFLVAGDKAGNWDGWYREMIPVADERFARHLAELDAGEAERR